MAKEKIFSTYEELLKWLKEGTTYNEYCDMLVDIIKEIKQDLIDCGLYIFNDGKYIFPTAVIRYEYTYRLDSSWFKESLCYLNILYDEAKDEISIQPHFRKMNYNRYYYYKICPKEEIRNTILTSIEYLKRYNNLLVNKDDNDIVFFRGKSDRLVFNPKIYLKKVEFRPKVIIFLTCLGYKEISEKTLMTNKGHTVVYNTDSCFYFGDDYFIRFYSDIMKKYTNKISVDDYLKVLDGRFTKARYAKMEKYKKEIINLGKYKEKSVKFLKSVKND